MPKHKCSYVSCYKLIDIKQRYCDEHAKSAHRSNSKYNKDSAANPETKFIRSRRWRKIRAMKIQATPVCERCNMEVAVIVDHCRERSDGGCEDCLDGLVSMCRLCHARKSAEVVAARKAGELERWYEENCDGEGSVSNDIQFYC